MSNIYLGFNAHGFPVRISRELACKMYKQQTGLDDERVEEIMDYKDSGGGAIYAGDNFRKFLIVFDETIKDGEAAIYIGGTPVRAIDAD